MTASSNRVLWKWHLQFSWFDHKNGAHLCFVFLERLFLEPSPHALRKPELVHVKIAPGKAMANVPVNRPAESSAQSTATLVTAHVNEGVSKSLQPRSIIPRIHVFPAEAPDITALRCTVQIPDPWSLCDYYNGYCVPLSPGVIYAAILNETVILV